MRVLFIAPRLPLPVDTGAKIRTFNILKQIAKNNVVDLVCFSFEQNDKKVAEELKKENIQVHFIAMKEPVFIQKVWQVLWGRQPYAIAKYYSKKMENYLTDLGNRKAFDMIHFDHLHMAHYRRCFNGIPCILDEHNVEYKILERCAGVEKSIIRKWIFRSQAQKMKDFETERIKKFDACLAVSEDDRQVLDEGAQGATPSHVISNGVDTEYFKTTAVPTQPSVTRRLSGNSNFRSGQGARQEKTAGVSRYVEDFLEPSNAGLDEKGILGQPPRLVFTGSMDWLPNRDAAVYFCNQILPLIWKVRQDIEFYIVGRNPSQDITTLAEGEPRIVVTGGVEDVRPFVEEAAVYVVPLRIGGGTRLKILEAMAMNKVVVSTTVGAEGIRYTDGENIVVADRPEDFADKVICHMSDKEKRVKIGVSARELVLGHYDWNIIGRELSDVYQKTRCTQ